MLDEKMWDLSMAVQYIHGQNGLRDLGKDIGKKSKDDCPRSKRLVS